MPDKTHNSFFFTPYQKKNPFLEAVSIPYGLCTLIFVELDMFV